MSFEFKKRESVCKAVRRLARQRVDDALEHLDRCDRLEAVHEVRKDIKRLRALLRLVCTSMKRSDYQRFSAFLRKGAHALDAARDAHVKVNALAALSGYFKQDLAPRSFRVIKTILSANCRKQRLKLSRTHAYTAVRRLLKKFSRDIASLRLKDSGWSALGPGIKRSYGDGQRCYRAAQKNGTPKNFHDWRKRVKDLYYQSGLLCPIWPEQICAVQAELKQLGQWLGDDHDFFLLDELSSTTLFRKHAEQETEALQALANERQKDLRTRALALGARFYGEKPSVFCKRLKQYWKRWRCEPKRVTQAV